MGKNKKKNEDGNHAIVKFRASDAIIMIIIILLCATCILPFVHLLAKSLSDNSYVMAQDVYLWPKGFTTQAYHSIFKDGVLVGSLGYSALVTLIFTILGMLVTICAAYPLSKKRLKGRGFITFVLMLTMYFSAGVIPEYLLIYNLGLLDNMWAIILPLIFSPYNMLIMKTSLQGSIPDELEESAYLDGATNFQILWKIVLPLSKPVIATLSLFYAVGRWNSYSDVKYYIKSRNKQLIQYILAQMVLAASDTQYSINEGGAVHTDPEVLKAASVMFATVPIMCIYPFVQKYFVKGVMIGAVKG